MEAIQSRLLDVGSAVATPVPSANSRKLARVQFDEDATTILEVLLQSLVEDLQGLILSMKYIWVWDCV